MKKRTSAQVFSYEFCEAFLTIFNAIQTDIKNVWMVVIYVTGIGYEEVKVQSVLITWIVCSMLLRL